jgi:hypothetical protein
MRRRLQFELDPHIIHHVIHSQAGSIGKALIELIMNAVDAGSPTFELTVTAKGFEAKDAGRGFASEEDVIRYFGRFGTPHQEGDATFGRFRLGRGQIMAHAQTLWQSNLWSMDVDTPTMGYAYDLDDLTAHQPGCTITGTWYEPLETHDLHTVIQELRDLVRYTPLIVTLNGTRITKDPTTEPWDHEDEFAYYRLRREGAMALYNQGVLVRHDPGHVWGVGGVIVSKKALDLNVSRSEILRKTCPVWKQVAARLKAHAHQFLAKEDPGRQSESARALRARELVVATGEALKDLVCEKVFTVLPGLRHISLRELGALSTRTSRLCAVPTSASVTRAETLAQSRLATLLHPRTLERFECQGVEEFETLINDVWDRARPYACRSWHLDQDLEWFPYQVLNDMFVEQTQVVPDQQIKDPETRRAWKCLKRALGSYLATVRSRWDPEIEKWVSQGEMTVLAGHSNTAEAWTDGETYIAIHIDLVKKLSGSGLSAAYRILALVDHELAHEGDSLNAVHDEAFYARYHDISLKHAMDRHHTIQRFLAYYSSAVYQSADRRQRKGWADRHDFNLKRINKLRQPFEGDEENSVVVPELSMTDEVALLDQVNHALRLQGAQPDQRSPEEIASAIDRHREQTAQANAERAKQAQAEAERLGQVKLFLHWLKQSRWYGLSVPRPEGLHEAIAKAAEEELEEEERYNTWDRDETTPEQAHRQALALLAQHPDYAGDPAVFDRFMEDIRYRDNDEMYGYDPNEEPDTSGDWIERPFAEYFPKDRLDALMQAHGLPLPDATHQEKLRGFTELVPIFEAYVHTHHHWPETGDEVWEWDRYGRPTLPAGLPLAVITRLAANLQMGVKAYLAWRAEEDQAD